MNNGGGCIVNMASIAGTVLITDQSIIIIIYFILFAIYILHTIRNKKKIEK
jgi:flagellar biogenesis protein FliO